METSEERSAIAKLLQRMDKSPGFAGLGHTVETISELDDDDGGGARKVTEAILRDAALTAKLLRIANSSRNARGSRNISTVDQAIVILGLNTVKSVALSLALLSSLSHRPQSKQLHAEIVAAYFCGSLAYNVTRLNGPRFNAQEAQVCGLMQNLGRMMAIYYLFEDIEKSRELQAEQNLTEDEAVTRTLGVSYSEIGAAIAHHWNLPDVIQQSLATDVGKAPPRSVASSVGWQQMCALFSRRITDALFRLPEGRERNEIAQAVEFFRIVLHLRDDEVREWIDKALTDTDTLLGEINFPSNVEQARNQLRKASERVLDMLSSQDSLTQGRNSELGRTPIEIIQHILRLIHDKHGFDRTLLCLPDGPSRLVAIAGVGRNASQIVSRFRCQGGKLDIFRVIMNKKVDMFIGDVMTPAYIKLMPDWYGEVVGARAFQMMALVAAGELLGMVYGDFAEPQTAPPPGLSEMPANEWRAQMIQALQAGKRTS